MDVFSLEFFSSDSMNSIIIIITLNENWFRNMITCVCVQQTYGLCVILIVGRKKMNENYANFSNDFSIYYHHHHRDDRKKIKDKKIQESRMKKKKRNSSIENMWMNDFERIHRKNRQKFSETLPKMMTFKIYSNNAKNIWNDSIEFELMIEMWWKKGCWWDKEREKRQKNFDWNKERNYSNIKPHTHTESKSKWTRMHIIPVFGSSFSPVDDDDDDDEKCGSLKIKFFFYSIKSLFEIKIDDDDKGVI